MDPIMRKFFGSYSLPFRSMIGGTLTLPSGRQIAIALLLGTIFGLMALIIEPILVLLGMIGLILLIMTFIAPEVVILVVLCLASGLVPDRFNPFVDLLVGHAQVSDLLLLWLLFVVVFRVFTDKSFAYVKSPLDLPIILLFGAVLVGLANSVARFGIEFSHATFEVRILMYYLIFFPITNLVRTRSQLIRLGQGVLAIGLLLAVIMIAQSSMVGLTSLVDNWTVSVGEVGEVVRVFHPGFPVVYMVVIAQISYMALNKHERRSLSRWLQVLVMGAALFVTVTRNIFVTIAFGFTLLLAIITKSERVRLMRNVLIIAIIAAGLISLLVIFGRASEILDYSVTFYERLKSMFSSDIFEPGDTLVYRWEEIQFAWKQISEHPILGIGLYNPYRPLFFPDEHPFLRLYIHNTFLSLWLKTGLLGLVSFLWFSLVFINRGFREWRNVGDDFLRSLLIGFTIGYAGIMISNFVAPSMIESSSLVIFSVILGLNELIILNTNQAKSDKNMEALSAFQSMPARE
ncbi:MAG: hypothetical protein A2Z14_08130 [Chloroflexi bacterium RBG_16_48_8]|nr:MAG: hypothetical protein A2Z14_08130 [Chloroflexi bacterium RBG_16_48_8]